MDQHIQVNRDYNVVVCIRCKRALTPGQGVVDHLRHTHRLAGTELKTIQEYLALGTASNPKTSPLPRNGGPRQPVIPVERGFQCRGCPFITTSEKNANLHWKSTGHTTPGPRYQTVHVQSWMGGRYARYWIVGHSGYDPGDGYTSERGSEEQPLSMLDTIVEASAKRVCEANTQWRRAGQAIQGADYDNEFIKDMGWVEFAEGKDRAVIAKATCWVRSKDMDVNTADEPAEQGAQLAMLCESIIRVMQQCVPRIRAVPKAIRQRLHGIEEGKGSPTPFKMHAGENTLHKYGIILQRYICFCWRAFRMGQDEARDRLGMRLTDEQWGLLCDVHQALQEREDADDSGLGSSNSPDSSEGSILGDPYDSDLYDDGAYTSDTNESPTAERQSIPPRSEYQAQSYEPLDRALFRFIIASIKVKVGGALYTNALLCFFAAMAIRTGGGGFQPAGLFSGTVAAMLWVLRLFFLEDAFQDMPLDAEEIPVEKMEQFVTQHAAWLCVDRFTVVNTMINWMAYAKGHRNKTLATASVRWTDDNETLIHNGEHLRIHEFQRAACRLQLGVDRLANALFGSQWGTIGPNIDLQGIKDDTTFLGAGESFATNKANAWLRPGARLAIQASQSALFDARLNQWKRKGVAKWLSQLRRLKELLMVMGHVWLGMPGRGPEVTTMRHCDGLQVMRNVFLYNGHVMVVTDRDKAKSIRDMGRKVARFLPDVMGRVFVAYVAWLLPAEEVLEQALELPATPQANKEFMWRHGKSARWNTEKLSALLQREMGTAVGVRLGVARYRIMVIEMGRIVQGLQLAEMERRIEDENNEGFEVDELSGELLHVGGSWNIVWDLQSTHSTRTARQHYAVHIGMPGHLTPTLLRNFHEVSRLWHAFLNKGTPLQPWGRRVQTEQERGVEDTTVEAGDIEAESLAALQALEGEAATWRSPKQKECMHAILRLQGAQHLICVLPTGAGKSNLFMAPAVMAGRGTTVVVVPFSTLIDDLVGRAREKGVDAIQFRSSEVVLREAMPYVPRLVFVSADTAVAEDELFMAYVDKLAHGGHLQRIFIDEAHVAITDSSYREALTKLKELHRFTRPMVMLTATLMKTMERDFRAMVLLPNAAIIRDRTTKTNARYEFIQVERKEGVVEKATVQFIRQAMASMASQEKCVVYCKSIADCRTTAEELGCLCHHSEMSETARKEAIALWLSGQASPVIAATTGLGTGVNFGGIVVIVHQGIPYGLVDYIQQTGRGARQDGQTVQCIVIHDGVRPFEAKGITSVSLRNQHAMWTVATAPGCVREQIAMIMDGVLGECCGDVDGAVPCCRCAPRYVAEAGRGWQDTRGEGAPVAVRDMDVGTDALARRADAEETRARGHAMNASVFQEDVRARTVDERMARQWLEEVEDSCAACSIQSLLVEEGGLDRHSVDYHQEVGVHEALGAACPALDSGMVSHRVFRARLRFAAYSCCFTCKLPLDWCAQAKTDRGARDRCVYADKVLPVILVAASMTREAAWIRDEFAIDLADEAAFIQWLAGRQRFMDTRGTNMHVLWVRILRKVYGPRMRVAGL